MSNNLVSNEMRNANTKAIRNRDHWRRQYNHLAAAIRGRKLLMANTWVGDSVILEALKTQARTMMEERMLISKSLRETAYPYADKVK